MLGGITAATPFGRSLPHCHRSIEHLQGRARPTLVTYYVVIDFVDRMTRSFGTTIYDGDDRLLDQVATGESAQVE